MNRKPSKEKKTTKQNPLGEKIPDKKKTGNGIILGFQIVMAVLLVGAAVLLKTTFPQEYEETKRRYYVLLNEEISFGNIGRYVTNFFKAGDAFDLPELPESLPTGSVGTSTGTATSSEGANASSLPLVSAQQEPTESLPVLDESDERFGHEWADE